MRMTLPATMSAMTVELATCPNPAETPLAIRRMSTSGLASERSSSPRAANRRRGPKLVGAEAPQPLGGLGGAETALRAADLGQHLRERERPEGRHRHPARACRPQSP